MTTPPSILAIFDPGTEMINYKVDNSGTFSFSRVVRVDFDKSMTVAISPVPAHNYIIIDGVENFHLVQLVDVSGRVVRQFGTTAGTSFNVEGLSQGIYFVRLVADGYVTTLRMIKD